MLVSPDCAARKCTACTGDAWDEVADRLDSCFCRCHDDPAMRLLRDIFEKGQKP